MFVWKHTGMERNNVFVILVSYKFIGLYYILKWVRIVLCRFSNMPGISRWLITRESNLGLFRTSERLVATAAIQKLYSIN